MSNSLLIDIDVSAAKTALDLLRKSFDSFSTSAEQGAAKAASAVQRLNTAMQSLKTIDVSKGADSITRLNVAMQSLSSGSGVQRLVAELRSLTTIDVARLETQIRGISAALKSLQVPPGLSQIASQLRAVGAAAQTAGSQVTTAAGQLRTFSAAARESEGATQGFGSALGGVRSLAAGFGLALGAAGFGQFVSGAKQAIESSQGLKNTLTALTGSSTETAGGMRWVDDMAKRLSIDINGARDGFKQFSASALSAGKDMDTTKQIFENMSVGIASLNLSGEKAKLIFNALSQMMSKGTISAEELKQQLGDSLPGAVGLMAKAVGVGTAELLKMMEQGQLSSDQLLKFSEIVKNQYAAGLTEALNSPLAAMRNFSNSMILLQERFGKGFFDSLASGVNSLSNALQMDSVLSAIQTIGSALGSIATGFMDTFGAAIVVVSGLTNALSALLTPIGDFATWLGKLTGLLSDTTSATDKTNTALRLLGIALGALTIAGSIAAGMWVLSTAFAAASAAATMLGGALLRLSVLAGPWGLALAGVAAGLALLTNWLTKTDDAAKKQANTMDAATQAQAAFAGTTDELKEKMKVTTEKAEEFVAAQTKLKDGFEKVDGAAQKLPGVFAGLQMIVEGLREPLSGVADSTGKLALMLESIRGTPDQVAAGLTAMSEASSASAEPLATLNAALTTMAPLMSSLSTSTPAFAGALSSMTVPDLAGFTANVTTLATSSQGLTDAQTALGGIVSYLTAASPALGKASQGVERLASASHNLSDGFSAATLSGGALVTAMSNVDAGANTLIGTMRTLEQAARDALRAAQAAQSSSPSSEIGSGRYGGMSESLPETLTAPLHKFNNAPAFADGTANTSRHLSKLPGGGIPSILHPNEAVIPLSRGRKVPVDVNLSMTAPAQQVATAAVDLTPTARALELVASSQSDIADALTARAAPARNETGNAFVGSIANPADWSFSGAAAAGGSTRTAAPSAADTATSTAGAGDITIVIAEGAIQVHAGDLDGFKRSEDQIVRSLAGKIKRATRRVQ